MVSAPELYGEALARIHHEGFAFHADATASGILDLLAPVQRSGGLVLEIGCGSGLLTRHLADAGLRVLATDPSPAMLDLARAHAPGAEGFERLAVPSDPLPECDAIVSTGHALSYLGSEAEVREALRACAAALAPGGVMALDLEDLRTRDAQLPRSSTGYVGDDWMLVIERVSDGPTHFARVHHLAVRQPDGSYQREVERHDNVLIDVRRLVPEVLESAGLEVEIRASFGTETNMDGLLVVVARRPMEG